MHPDINCMINMASFRSAYQSSMCAMKYHNIKFISILAEGMAENQTRDLIKYCNEKNVTLLGPSTIGALLFQVKYVLVMLEEKLII